MPFGTANCAMDYAKVIPIEVNNSDTPVGEGSKQATPANSGVIPDAQPPASEKANHGRDCRARLGVGSEQLFYAVMAEPGAEEAQDHED
jgi:hypothetical protein